MYTTKEYWLNPPEVYLDDYESDLLEKYDYLNERIEEMERNGEINTDQYTSFYSDYLYALEQLKRCGYDL